jgi:hypothetical protein
MTHREFALGRRGPFRDLGPHKAARPPAQRKVPPRISAHHARHERRSRIEGSVASKGVAHWTVHGAQSSVQWRVRA